MYKLSLSKDLFEDILSKKLLFIEKKATNYWKKELFIPKIVDDAIFFEIKQVDKLLISNGLGEDKAQVVIECLKIEYLKELCLFRFYFGKILEQKNIEFFKDEKDTLIEILMNEKNELLKFLEDIKKGIK